MSMPQIKPRSMNKMAPGSASTASLRQQQISRMKSRPSLGVIHVDSTPFLPCEELDELDVSEVPWWTSKRLRLAVLCFFGFVCLYAQRVNLSIAMVAMVSHEEPRNHSESNSTNMSARTESEEFSKCPALSKSSTEAEFTWDKELVGLILGAFFWGYLVLQVPGGRLSERFGAKKVVALSMFPVAILNLLTPVTARLSPYLLLVLRVFVGVGESVMYPAAQALWSNWAPPNERTRLIGFSYAGGQFGNALMFPIAGYLCAYGPDGGWSMVFYFIGSVGFLWCVIWTVFAHDTPNENPTITPIERQYINMSLGRKCNTKHEKPKRPDVPWKCILTSRPFWAILVAHVCGNYGAYMMLTKIPAYMKEVLKFDIKSNGLYSMLPYLAFWATIAVGSIIADTLITYEILTVKNCRRLLATLGFLIPGFALIGVGFMECHQPAEAVVLLTISVGMCGLQFSSFFVSHSDIAPTFAGTLFGITNTMATIPGILSPYIVSAMTPDGTREQWQHTFYLAAGIYFFGAVWYCIFIESEVQPWAKQEYLEEEEEKKNDMNNSGNGSTAFDLTRMGHAIEEQDEKEEEDEDDEKKGTDLLASIKLIGKSGDAEA